MACNAYIYSRYVTHIWDNDCIWFVDDNKYFGFPNLTLETKFKVNNVIVCDIYISVTGYLQWVCHSLSPSSFNFGPVVQQISFKGFAERTNHA